MKSSSRHLKQAREPHLQGPSTSLVHALDRSTSPQSPCPIGSRSPCPPRRKRQQHSPARYPASAPSRRSELPAQFRDLSLCPRPQDLQACARNAEILRSQSLFRNRAASDLEDPRLSRRRDLIQTVQAVNDKSALHPKRRERFGHKFRRSNGRRADYLNGRPGRIQLEVPSKIERRPHLQFDSCRLRVLHRGMHRRSQHEPDPDFANALRDLRRSEVDVDSQRFEDVGAPALARQRSVAVLGDLHACARDDKSRHRRDIERA